PRCSSDRRRELHKKSRMWARGRAWRRRSRSRVEGEKRRERVEIEDGPCPCQKPRDGGDHGCGEEVSGSAVSVPRGETPTPGQRIAASRSAAPISKVML